MCVIMIDNLNALNKGWGKTKTKQNARMQANAVAHREHLALADVSLAVACFACVWQPSSAWHCAPAKGSRGNEIRMPNNSRELYRIAILTRMHIYGWNGHARQIDRKQRHQSDGGAINKCGANPCVVMRHMGNVRAATATAQQFNSDKRSEAAKSAWQAHKTVTEWELRAQ